MATHDWHAWHEGYGRAGSPLAQRLAVVRHQLRAVLDASPPGPLHAVSLCAGQGRDLLDVLGSHPRGPEVTALLVELDAALAEDARRRARALGLERVRVVTGDAARTDHYRGLPPADVVMLCGVFGNISDQDIRHTVAHAPGLCAVGGHVIWTRHRRPPDLVPRLCEWFAEEGFTTVRVTPADLPFGVATHRYEGPPRPLVPGLRLFRFR